MRLGFHYHIPALNRNGIINMPGYFGCFIDSLASKTSSLVCFLHSPIGEEIENMDYSIKSPNVSLVDLGPHFSITKRMLITKKIQNIIQKNLDQIDIMFIRGPSPLLPDIAKASGNLPLAFLIVGDYLAGVDGLPQPLWRKELIRVWSFWNAKRQLNLLKKNLTFVNSHILFQQFKNQVPNLIETRTTTLSINDFYKRNDTCQSRPIHILYTGRIDRAKGLVDILDAIKILIDQGEDLIFNLVGNIGKDKSILEEINNKAINYGISNRIIFHGYKPLGEELFKFYKDSDIYIIASQNSEGFPRTIWEAMAHSLPVIATKVGSIPAFIENAAELIQPRSVEEISFVIKRLIYDQNRRKELITKGFELAKTNTLEVRSTEIIDSLKNYLTNINSIRN